MENRNIRHVPGKKTNEEKCAVKGGGVLCGDAAAVMVVAVMDSDTCRLTHFFSFIVLWFSFTRSP